MDDFQIILEQMTGPDRCPVLHFWRTYQELAQRTRGGDPSDLGKERRASVGTMG